MRRACWYVHVPDDPKQGRAAEAWSLIAGGARGGTGCVVQDVLTPVRGRTVKGAGLLGGCRADFVLVRCE